MAYSNTYNSMNSLNNGFSNMSFNQTSGANMSIPQPPPLPSRPLWNNNSNNFLGSRNLYTREWNLNGQQWGDQPFQVYSSMPATTYTQQTLVSAQPAVIAAPANDMLPAPINDGRRYARLTGQKAGSRRSRRHLVQPLNGTGLTTLPAGVPVEGLAAAPSVAGGRSGRRAGRRGNNAAALNVLPTTNYVSLGANPNGSALPMQQQRAVLPVQQQQTAFVPQQQATFVPQQQSFVSQQASFIPQQQIISQPALISQPTVVAQPTLNMLPAPINDGRRYARLTGQKAGSRRSRRHLVQPLNGTGLTTLPAGVPVEGLNAAASTNGRRSRRMASRGLNNNAGLVSAPLASAVLPTNTTALPGPHMAQIPLGAPRVSRAGQRNRKNNAARGLTSAPMSTTPIIPTSVMSASAVPYVSQQPMIKQEMMYTPVNQPALVGGARF